MVPTVPAMAKLNHTFRLALGFGGDAGGGGVPLISRPSVFGCLGGPWSYCFAVSRVKVALGKALNR